MVRRDPRHTGLNIVFREERKLENHRTDLSGRAIEGLFSDV